MTFFEKDILPEEEIHSLTDRIQICKDRYCAKPLLAEVLMWIVISCLLMIVVADLKGMAIFGVLSGLVLMAFSVALSPIYRILNWYKEKHYGKEQEKLYNIQFAVYGLEEIKNAIKFSKLVQGIGKKPDFVVYRKDNMHSLLFCWGKVKGGSTYIMNSNTQIASDTLREKDAERIADTLDFSFLEEEWTTVYEDISKRIEELERR